jgi:hypothetical protein
MSGMRYTRMYPAALAGTMENEPCSGPTEPFNSRVVFSDPWGIRARLAERFPALYSLREEQAANTPNGNPDKDAGQKRKPEYEHLINLCQMVNE